MRFVPIDPSILDEAGVIAYDDSLTIDVRRERLGLLAAVRPELEGSVTGYLEMLALMRSAYEHDARRHWAAAPGDELPVFLTWATHADALREVEECGAQRQVEDALRRAYRRTADEPRGRLRPSRVVEEELAETGWEKTVVRAQEGLRAKDSFDGLKHFPDTNLTVAVEVEWPWTRVMGDLLKFWRAERLGQIDLGIEVLRGPDAFDYVVQHVYAMYRELIPELRVVFCALHAPDLREPFPVQGGTGPIGPLGGATRSA